MGMCAITTCCPFVACVNSCVFVKCCKPIHHWATTRYWHALSVCLGAIALGLYLHLTIICTELTHQWRGPIPLEGSGTWVDTQDPDWYTHVATPPGPWFSEDEGYENLAYINYTTVSAGFTKKMLWSPFPLSYYDTPCFSLKYPDNFYQGWAYGTVMGIATAFAAVSIYLMWDEVKVCLQTNFEKLVGAHQSDEKDRLVNRGIELTEYQGSIHSHRQAHNHVHRDVHLNHNLTSIRDQ